MSQWIPTARNSERWRRENEKAQRYLAPTSRERAKTQGEIAREGLALRHAFRIEREFSVRRDGSPREHLLQRLLTWLLGVREAENVYRLIDRDRTLAGAIAGIAASGALDAREIDLLIKLRTDALTRRQAELLKREVSDV